LFLQKLIKELPSLVPAEETASRGTTASANLRARAPLSERRADSIESLESTGFTDVAAGGEAEVPRQQHRGDNTAEEANAALLTTSSAGPRAVEGASSAATDHDHHSHANQLEQRKEELGRNPGEKAFFKFLHAELRKASHFFDRAQQEFLIREERVRKGMDIMKQPNSIMVNEKWSMLAKSIYRLYKDLLLLETFAIMTYCSFSKILKKHDKVTGHQTRNAFMQNVVNKANFTNYPKVLDMISRCELLYDEVSQLLQNEGNEGLYEDERLFINMISRLNEQVLNTAEGEGAPDRQEGRNRLQVQLQQQQEQTQDSYTFPAPQQEKAAINTLRSLVEEHDAETHAAQISEGGAGCDEVDDRKRPANASSRSRFSKYQRTE